VPATAIHKSLFCDPLIFGGLSTLSIEKFAGPLLARFDRFAYLDALAGRDVNLRHRPGTTVRSLEWFRVVGNGVFWIANLDTAGYATMAQCVLHSFRYFV
jgi:hypothetical protein